MGAVSALRILLPRSRTLKLFSSMRLYSESEKPDSGPVIETKFFDLISWELNTLEALISKT